MEVVPPDDLVVRVGDEPDPASRKPFLGDHGLTACCSWSAAA
jgi:hypothetical protein